MEQVMLSFSEEDDPNSSFFYLDRIHSAQEHDDIITGIVLTADKSKLVTASYDKSFVVLEKDSANYFSLPMTDFEGTRSQSSYAIPNSIRLKNLL